MVITPFVFLLVHPNVRIQPSHEATEVMWSPLAPMADGETRTTLPYEYRGRTVQMPGFRVREHIVWGLTYRMLESFFEILRFGAQTAP